jgi:hypothetical protein
MAATTVDDLMEHAVRVFARAGVLAALDRRGA